MHENEKLEKHEWIVILSLILLLGSITFVTHKQGFSLPLRQHSEPHYVYDQKMHIRIEGAVEFPGTYPAERGATMQEVLHFAKPDANADLKKLPLTKKLRDGQTIKVPAKEYITIFVEGAVEQPGALKVAKGAKLEELIELIAFAPGADLDKLKRKRRLKEGETIKVKLIPN